MGSVGQVGAHCPGISYTHPDLSAKSTLSRLNATPAERLARERRMAGAVRTILECIGEDPDREGLLRTPERYAQAIMWMTRGYEERLTGVFCLQFLPVSQVTIRYRCHQRCDLRRRPR